MQDDDVSPVAPRRAIDIYGDILSADKDCIVHQIDATSVIANGLSNIIFKAFPFSDVCIGRKKEDEPGTTIMRKDGTKAIVALVAQKWVGMPLDGSGDGPIERLSWFQRCLRNLLTIERQNAYYFPFRIGCGPMSGGNWKLYRDAIDTFASLVDADVFIVNPIREKRFRPQQRIFSEKSSSSSLDVRQQREWQPSMRPAAQSSSSSSSVMRREKKNNNNRVKSPYNSRPKAERQTIRQIEEVERYKKRRKVQQPTLSNLIQYQYHHPSIQRSRRIEGGKMKKNQQRRRSSDATLV